jgi:peptide/nickel transport system permease protein
MCAKSTADEATNEFRRFEEEPLWSRIAANPQPAAIWASVAFVLIAVEFGAFAGGLLTILDALVIGVTALFDIVLGLFSASLEKQIIAFQQTASGFVTGFRDYAESLPTLLSRQTIDNQGYQTPDGTWHGTFLGLSPAVAWALRVLLVVGYSLFAFYWTYKGWIVFRENYRKAKWTPRDDMEDRLRNHRWGQFGIVVVILFLTMGLFGPALGPSTVDKNIVSGYQHEIQYYDGDAGQVQSVYVGTANYNSKSKGQGGQNVGVMTYDDYGRFHPFGTTPDGRDLFTFMMGGARITLQVTALALGLSAFIATLLSLVSAYYKGLIDLTILVTGEGVVAIPQFLLLILISIVFQGHWIMNLLQGGFLIALIYGLTGWPFLWRAVRGPALQVSDREWIDAAKSYGQRPTKTMQKHMLPYVLGYLLVYTSMSAGSVIIGLASLSFIGNGLGIQPPTPAWGRAVAMGQEYVATPSWHISLIPGLMIVVLVTGLNAFGDGIRDAIDPQSEGVSEDEAAAGGGTA